MAELNKTLLFEHSYPSDKNIRQGVVESIISVIGKNHLKLALSEEELYLVIDEAVTNAMEHGNEWDPGKKIIIEIVSNAHLLYITITDEGKGFDIRKIKKAMKNRNVLSTRGRGIFIINQFCSVTWNDGGNQIQLAISFEG